MVGSVVVDATDGDGVSYRSRWSVGTGVGYVVAVVWESEMSAWILLDINTSTSSWMLSASCFVHLCLSISLAVADKDSDTVRSLSTGQTHRVGAGIEVVCTVLWSLLTQALSYRYHGKSSW